MSMLPAIAGQYPMAFDINDRGAMTGRVGDAGFVYDHGAAVTFALPGTRETEGLRINENGQVAGVGWYGGYDFHAMYWSGTQAIDLNQSEWSTSQAVSINDAGAVIGTFRSSGPTSGFLYQDGVMTILPEFEGRPFIPNDINNAGDIVGRILLPERPVALLYRDGVFFRFDDLVNGVALDSTFHAGLINDRGDVAGWEWIDGADTLVLLTAVPEPRTATMLLGGLMLVSLRLWVRSRFR